jgi:hypothetical protein
MSEYSYNYSAGDDAVDFLDQSLQLSFEVVHL